MTLTKEEAAAQMNGCEYGAEGTPELFAAMKAARLVAVFGYSDDVTELHGAVEDETYSETHFTRDGILENKCYSGCPYFERDKRAAKKLTADFGNEGWTYETTIPHASFDVMEDGELYGKGLVFSLDDLG